MDYLPKDATIEQACGWLHARTGQTWVLPRLLECNLTPHFWLDYKPDYPIIFGNRIEGYQTRMVFHGDICRLEADGAVALVNMFAAHDGVLIKVEPAMRVPLAELRFKRAAIERVAEITNNQPTAGASRGKVGVASQVPEQDKKTFEPVWPLRRPSRFQGYGKPLYDFLKAASIAGNPMPPTARDVLDAWKIAHPPEVMEVTNEGLKYYDARGNVKAADLNAIRQSINRMLG